jgi:ferredoxin-NADP reductase
MDREAGIDAYANLIDADTYRARRNAGTPPEHIYTADQSDVPVLALDVTRATPLTDAITLYELSDPDGADLPPFTAGGHIDVVVAPEFFRQYSLSGDPANRKSYQIAVLREDAGRGGSALMHRIFEVGRRVFVSKPINHFPLAPDGHSYLMGGGIGVTPMVAMAHALYAQGRSFDLHYSVTTRADAGFILLLQNTPWADAVHIHISDEGTRADLMAVLPHRMDAHVYTCGPDSYMQAVMNAAAANGFDDEHRHLEFFAVPEAPDYENHPFALQLADGRQIAVAADEAASDALLRAGIHVDVKCADGLCGVCQCGVTAGVVEHRDYVLSKAQRSTNMILCQSRAARKDSVISIDL